MNGSKGQTPIHDTLGTSLLQLICGHQYTILAEVREHNSHIILNCFCEINLHLLNNREFFAKSLRFHSDLGIPLDRVFFTYLYIRYVLLC